MKVLTTVLALFTSAAISLQAQADVNLRLDPTGLVVGSSKLELDVPVAKSITLGPRVGYWNQSLGGYHEVAYSIGLIGTYTFSENSFESAWFISAGAIYQSMKISDGAQSGSGSGAVFEVLGGYQWFWSNGLNLHLGVGPTVSTQNSVALSSSDSSQRERYTGLGVGLHLASDISLGYVF